MKQNEKSEKLGLNEEDSKYVENWHKLKQAIDSLQEFCVPENMPCRDEEKDQILKFCQKAIIEFGSSSSLYIYGVPGLGKTACLLEVVHALYREEYQDAFKFI